MYSYPTAHHSVAGYDFDEAMWNFVTVKLLAALQSGSVRYPQLHHGSTNEEAMQESTRTVTAKHLSSESAEPKQLLFIFFRGLTLFELSDDPDILPVVFPIVLGGT